MLLAALCPLEDAYFYGFLSGTFPEAEDREFNRFLRAYT
jgi:hypothetical protein